MPSKKKSDAQFKVVIENVGGIRPFDVRVYERLPSGGWVTADLDLHLLHKKCYTRDGAADWASKMVARFYENELYDRFKESSYAATTILDEEVTF